MGRSIVVRKQVDNRDALELTRDQKRRITKDLQRIADLPDPAKDPFGEVKPLKGKGLSGFYIHKSSAAMRGEADMEVRTVFRADSDTLEVWAALPRDKAYPIAVSRIRKGH